MLTVLHDKATAHYEEYAINPDMVLGRHQSLFTTCTLAERLHSPYDALAAWIRSVNEAILVRDQHDAALRETSQLFFPSQPTHPDLPTDSSYTEHTSTDEETSLDTTQATTNTSVTSHTMNSNISLNTTQATTNTSVTSHTMNSNISLDTTHTYIRQIEDGTSSVASDFDDTTCSTDDTDTSTSGVALPVTFGTASLVQPALNIDILSFAYSEQTTTLTSNDPELNYDYIDHGTECSQLTQASYENRSYLTATSVSSESNPIVPTSISWNMS
jgi:hypothetical protein